MLVEYWESLIVTFIAKRARLNPSALELRHMLIAKDKSEFFILWHAWLANVSRFVSPRWARSQR